ncbi:MAG: methionine synthase, partial [bacterium]
MKRIVGATLGNCIHVMGLLKFLELASSFGYKTEFAGQCLPLSKIMEIALTLNENDIIALSYRLTPESGERLFKELRELKEKHRPKCLFIFGGTPQVAEKARASKGFDFVFSGKERIIDIVSFLRSGATQETRKTFAQTLPERIAESYPYPLIR